MRFIRLLMYIAQYLFFGSSWISREKKIMITMAKHLQKICPNFVQLASGAQVDGGIEKIADFRRYYTDTKKSHFYTVSPRLYIKSFKNPL